MAWWKILIIVLISLFTIFVTGTIGAYWWANSTPRRPKGVSSNALYLQAPGLPFPTKPHGTWLECWQQMQRDFCKSTMVDGTVLLEDEYLLYGPGHELSADQLKIDLAKTGQEYVHAPNGFPTPLIHLQNGDILIPATRYQEGILLLKGFSPRN